MPDTLAADAIAPLLRGRFGVPLLFAEACESTQQLLTPAMPEGAVAVCDHQTAGRGRLGRRWDAPPGRAILCSVLLRPPAAANAPELSLVGGVAVALTVERALGRASQLKWPNDVLVDGRKIAGVLGEVRSTAVVLGIGLNVNQDAGELPRGPALPATSLFVADGSRRLRAPLLAGLLLDLEDLYARWQLGGLAGITGEVSARDYLRGRRVAVGGVEGTALGITRDGRLEIETASGPRRVASGDVTVQQPA